MDILQRILLLHLESEMDGCSSRSFCAISDIQSSPIGDERSSVCQLCQK